MVALTDVHFRVKPDQDLDIADAREAWDRFEARDYGAALRKYQNLRRRYPDDADLLGLVGITEFRLGRLKNAAVSLEKALEISPMNPDLLSAYAAVLGSTGVNEQALGILEAAIRLEPAHPEAHFNRALALANLNRTQEAVSEIDKSLDLELDESDRIAFIDLRRLLIETEVRHLVEEGLAFWSGGKPQGSNPPAKLSPGPSIVEMIREGRR
jgi:tetratricopeptide (TPR) repeat protein